MDSDLTYMMFFPQVPARTVAYISVEDAVHCGSGCSALQRRLQCTAPEMGKTGTEIASPILDKRKGSDDSPLRVIVLPLGK